MLTVILGKKLTTTIPKQENSTCKVILPCIVQDTQIPGAPTFHTDADKSQKGGYTSENLCNVDESLVILYKR